MTSHETKKLEKLIGLCVEPKRKKYKKQKKDEPVYVCCICHEIATEGEPGEMTTKFINCKLAYLTDGKQKRHKDNDKAICKVCRSKLKEQQGKFPNRNMKNQHCPFCRSHDPLAKPPALCRMPRKKKSFIEAKKSKIKKLEKELKKEKKRRKQLFGYFYEDEIMIQKKFRPLKIYREREEMKKERIHYNKIRLPQRRN